MSETFRGEINQRVDAKARVSIPATFRRILEAEDPAFSEGARARFVLVYGGDRAFVEGFSIRRMARMEKRIAKMPDGSKTRAYLERNMIVRSQIIEIDDDGRIVLPVKARDKLAIGADDLKSGLEAIFTGTLDRFQIWKGDTYSGGDAAEPELDEEDLPEGADMLSLLPPDEED